MRGTVLIIEDDFLCASELSDVLQDAGYTHIEIADSEQAAVEAAMANRPCLITADYSLLEGTGPSAVRTIQRKLGPIPVVFVTGNGNQVDIPEATIVDKPMSTARFRAALAAVTKHKLPH